MPIQDHSDASFIPYRFRESSFRLYEPMIADAVNTYPQVVLVDPASLRLSIDTVCARLRDAVAGFITYDHPTSSFVRARLLEVWPTLRVVQRPPKVLIGTKEAIAVYDKDPRAAMSAAPPSINPALADPFDFTSNPCEVVQFRVLLLLTSLRLLNRPLRLRLADLSMLGDAAMYDVDVEDMGDGTIILR